MAKENDSLKYIPPPLQHLFNYPIRDDINIEDGLYKPENHKVFLISSIAFLQKHLMRKFETGEYEKEQKEVGRNYSDSLIVESGQKYMRQKMYIKLSNIEKFNEILRREASLPEKILSNNQLLPSPKKTKSSKLSNIFKLKQSNSSPSTLTAKRSIFNIFKKNISSISTNLPPLNADIEVDTEKIFVTTETENIPDELTLTKSSSSGIRKTSSTNTNTTNETFDSELTSELNPKRALSEDEEEILRIIPKNANLTIKRNMSEKFRSSSHKSVSTTENDDEEDTISSTEMNLVMNDDDYYEDPETGIKFKCMPAESIHSTRKLKEQQSKLSVCMEEEMESDIDYGQEKRKYPFNCTDDDKALVSTEGMELVISKVWNKINVEK